MAATARIENNQSPLAHIIGQTGVDKQRGQGDDAEVASDNQAGGHRVRHAALEDQVGVHQPVADDGPTEGERQNDDGEVGQIGEPTAAWLPVEEEGYRVKRA